VAIKSAADLAGKSVGVTRGAIEDMELTKIAPRPAPTSSASRTTTPPCRPSCRARCRLIATGASVAGNMMARNPQLGTEYKLC
jgi:polar amino acid transport system substrate-binding protein